MFTAYAEIATDLAVDIAAIFLLAYVLYFRRHRRADLLLAYVALNIGIFVAISLLTTVRVDIALGFGLFAILSIIRLRSTSVTQQEVAYYFVALVLGLVNGMDIPDRRLVVMINVLLLGAMAIVDSRGLRERTRRMDVHLDVVHADDASLVADLERRLGGTVLHHEVNDVDYVRQTMLVDVRYRAGTHPVVAPVDERQLEVTLDVVHAEDAALVADLEHRLGGQVLRHQVKDIDYVRDTMEVEVTYRVWTPVVHAHPGHTAHDGHHAYDGTVNGSAQLDGQLDGQHRRAGQRTHERSAVMSVTALDTVLPPCFPARSERAARAAHPGDRYFADGRRSRAGRAGRPIGLAESTALAELQTRVDRKYFVPAQVFGAHDRGVGRCKLRVLDIDGEAHVRLRVGVLRHPACRPIGRMCSAAVAVQGPDPHLPRQWVVHVRGQADRGAWGDGQGAGAAPGAVPGRVDRGCADPLEDHVVRGLPPGPAAGEVASRRW